jgi:hypothetical protein
LNVLCTAAPVRWSANAQIVPDDPRQRQQSIIIQSIMANAGIVPEDPRQQQQNIQIQSIIITITKFWWVVWPM